MNRAVYMLGLLIVVFSGFFLIYSALKNLPPLEHVGFSVFVTGLIIGVIGVVVSEERMKTALISIGLALATSLFITVLTILTPNISPTIFTFPLLFVIIFAIAYIAMALLKKQK